MAASRGAADKGVRGSPKRTTAKAPRSPKRIPGVLGVLAVALQPGGGSPMQFLID